MELNGKTALIPGAARPVGRAIARALAFAGCRLILPVFDWPDSNQDLIDTFRKDKIDFWAPEVDLRNKEQVEDLASSTQERFGKLHILINNIERGGMPVVHGSYNRPYNQDQWQLEIDTTLKAKWLLFDNFSRLLAASGDGAVVNISSIAGVMGRSGPAGLVFNDAFAAANRAISSFTETWARAGAPEIRVNELQLGLIQHRHGEGTRGWEVMTPEERQSLLNHTLLGRSGSPEEAAAAVLFLLRDADFMTGTILKLDGGFTLGGDQIKPMPPGILEA
ncbi:MAG: SDR family oxidoreductase [Desulfobulbaceae bacterium]|uniref:SDR family oxidoreductase n=1 Tax=Candidatus Desulfatifera sulfidica TaxID=2841691 RepID=A0A8J6N985_9BACT|nr:SDR family oxidoreductase [Candidatus Desulfatifera sulfidica]